MRLDILFFILCSHGLDKNCLIQYAWWVYYVALFYFYFPLEIVMLMTSIVCAGCLRAEEEIFGALAQVR